ncbi:MAG: SDR family NAD(P)-dependent oxidoreductase [Dehalococcoidia bacterium]
MAFYRDRRVLVTGGAGFIGANLVQRLVQEGARVRVVDSLERMGSENTAAFRGSVEFLERDLGKMESCMEACQDVEMVFHLAAAAGSSDHYRRHPAEVMLQNLIIDAHVLAAARKCRVQRYFYMSSVFVYPEGLQRGPDAPPLREEDALPACPPLSYGWAKLVGERALEYAVSEGPDLKGVIFRLSNAYGPYQDGDWGRGSIIPVLVQRAVQYPQGPFSIKGTGEETRSYCYISDVLDAMLLAMARVDGYGLLGPLNIGGEERVRIMGLAREIADISGKGMEVVCLPGPSAVWSQAIDCSKARQLLDGWEPRVSLREGLTRTYAYWEARLNDAVKANA